MSIERKGKSWIKRCNAILSKKAFEGGGSLKAPSRRALVRRAFSPLVAFLLAASLCPSVALASPKSDSESDAIQNLASENNAYETMQKDSAAADEPSGAAEDSSDKQAGAEDSQANALYEERKAVIDGVTYTYSVEDDDYPYGAGVYISNASGKPSVTIPAQIEGWSVKGFEADADSGIVHLDASRAPNLKTLYAFGLKTLNVSNNAALELLNVGSGSSKAFVLSELDVRSCSSLRHLDCGNNRITSLDVSKNASLEVLCVQNNRLAQLDVSGNPALKSIYCFGNLLTELDVSANKSLEYLVCFDNYIPDTKALVDRFGSTDVLPQNTNPTVSRLAGDSALDTMASITREGFVSSDTVIVATMGGYWDALAASSLAGVCRCPILLTDGNSLSSQAASEIKRLEASTVYIAGGTAAVSAEVESSLKAISGVKTVKRLAGDIAINTALKIYEEGKGSWGTTAIVATSETFQDALSVSPYAFARQAPIFLANATTHKLDSQVLSAIKTGGFDRVVVVGGTAALSSQIESQQLKGITCVRLAGATAYETSTAIADWCLTQGMMAANVGIATGSDYYDALAGAALCGRNDSALVLVSDDNRSSIDSFIAPNKGRTKHAYVFGGPAAVSSETFKAIEAALK